MGFLMDRYKKSHKYYLWDFCDKWIILLDLYD